MLPGSLAHIFNLEGKAKDRVPWSAYWAGWELQLQKTNESLALSCCEGSTQPILKQEVPNLRNCFLWPVSIFDESQKKAAERLQKSASASSYQVGGCLLKVFTAHWFVLVPHLCVSLIWTNLTTVTSHSIMCALESLSYSILNNIDLLQSDNNRARIRA